MFVKVGIALVLVVMAMLSEAKYSNFPQNQAMTYADALAHCRSKGHYLLNVESALKQKEVVDMLRKENFTRIWIAINRRNDTHDNPPYEWKYERIPKAPIGNFYWAEGEPNNYLNTQERCVEILDRKGDPRYNATNNWNDMNCNRESPFFCETY